ncbi:ABC-F family ATP-binding cassette domain-containing protein [Pseudogracilibacillus sp. SO30301A]|uniref:ABC-F family ATP-binding cassette domain-containing protein n=1 Tax=Pseudogracilibacillus sp. SO30301A TaxID=3098291 RepID=UPI00300E386E
MLTIENLSKSYGEKVLFEDINTTITSSDRIGLIGVNGTGKSTFLKIIAGIETADKGNIQHSKDYMIEYLAQNPEFIEDVSVLEYIFAGEAKIMQVLREYERSLLQLEQNPNDETTQSHLLYMQQQMDKYDAWEASTVAKTVLTKMGITQFDEKVTMLSGGQKKRVAIAKALIQPADLLILDEPTNHLDNETIVWLEKYFEGYKGALLLVTHDRYFLNQVTNQIYELEHGKMYIYEGSYELFLEKKLERKELEQNLQQKHQNTLKKEIAWLKRGARARSTKQKARIDRIDTLKKQKFNTNEENIEIQVGSTRLGKQVIELKSISKVFGEKTLWKNFSILITPGDRIGIIGPNGAGKSTLLNIIAGRYQPDEGEVKIGETVKIGYYTQGEEELNESLRVIEYIKEIAEVIYTKEGKLITAEQMLERFLFSRPKQWTYIGSLSGGEKRRLYLLKVLMQEPNVIILDEPTNDLDIKTLGILEEYLEHFPGVVLTVSHDRYFLDNVVDELIVFDGNGGLRHYYGNYSEYASEMHSDTQKEGDKKLGKLMVREKKVNKKLSYNEQKEWDVIEDEITQLEERIFQLQSDIAASGSDFAQVQELYQEQQTLEAELETKMDRWEELSLLIESFKK